MRGQFIPDTFVESQSIEKKKILQLSGPEGMMSVRTVLRLNPKALLQAIV
jgi:hypothetical protein